MWRGREGAAGGLGGVCGIAGNAQDLFCTIVVRRKIGVAEGPIHAEPVDSRRPKGVLGKAMRFPLVVQCRATESEDPFVSERTAAEALIGCGSGKTGRSEMGVAG